MFMVDSLGFDKYIVLCFNLTLAWIRSNEIDISMVRAVGIEPTLLAEQDFESCASTSSTTPAHHARPT
jgi:hypothetical protein